jgi:general secretion pathway protein G
MRQIGSAIQMYAEDNDELYPNAADPSDIYTNLWAPTKYAAIVKTLPLLQNVVAPYVSSPNVWNCPSDTGYDNLDMAFFQGYPQGVPLNARPTMFKAFGTSYLYRTELALTHTSINSGCKSLVHPQTDGGPSDINVLMDGNGGWHGTASPLTLGLIDERSYNVLMGDCHVTHIKASVLNEIWSCTLD